MKETQTAQAVIEIEHDTLETSKSHAFLVDESIEADFAVIATDDSMINAGIHNGDVVLARYLTEPEVANGALCIFITWDKEIYLRRFFRIDGQIQLLANNPAYSPMVFDETYWEGWAGGILLAEVVAYMHYFKEHKQQ